MSETVWSKMVQGEDLLPSPGIEGRWRRLVSPTDGNCGMIFGMGELPPRQIMGWHAHPEPEIFVVLEGHGEARWKESDEERRAPLDAGFAFYKVGGVPHTMVNLGDAPLRGVFFKINQQ